MHTARKPFLKLRERAEGVPQEAIVREEYCLRPKDEERETAGHHPLAGGGSVSLERHYPQPLESEEHSTTRGLPQADEEKPHRRQ